MNKKIIMFITCAVFLLIMSCNNDASVKYLKQNLEVQEKKQNLEGTKEKVKNLRVALDELKKKVEEEKEEESNDLSEDNQAKLGNIEQQTFDYAKRLDFNLEDIVGDNSAYIVFETEKKFITKLLQMIEEELKKL
ncbi:hypothetical protein QIA34_07185 (plasmid) [Borreliella yangtzensis]|uniref:Methylthioribose-1-phosphate isomerase n=1 Tax=Borreliella yangtzensis TaxID=683292 RepID=A0ABR6PG84_9SPIR|nr:methylthioribose-1-phosphate isomerase [Borreliella yangtzensis]